MLDRSRPRPPQSDLASLQLVKLPVSSLLLVALVNDVKGDRKSYHTLSQDFTPLDGALLRLSIVRVRYGDCSCSRSPRGSGQSCRQVRTAVVLVEVLRSTDYYNTTSFCFPSLCIDLRLDCRFLCLLKPVLVLVLAEATEAGPQNHLPVQNITL